MSDGDNRGEFDIPVLSKDPENKEDDKPKHTGEDDKATKDEKDTSEMSEEDQQLKSELEMLVERLKESDTGLYLPALESLRTLIRTSTSSMTSVPKPLKFLRPHYEDLGALRKSWNKDLKEQRALLASILSVLAMTYSDTGKRDTLYYRLISQSSELPGSWGHEYVRHLAAELGEEYNAEFAGKEDDEVKEEPTANGESAGAHSDEESRKYTDEQLKGLAGDLVDFFLKHNAEADAVDLLLEVEDIKSLVDKVNDRTWPRVCQYMVNCVPLLVAPDDVAFLETAAQIYAKHDQYPEALALAVRLNNRALVWQYYRTPTNPVMKKQLSYFLARAQVPLQWVHTSEDYLVDLIEDGPPIQSDDIISALGNEDLSKYFRSFGKAVGVEKERTPDEVYKAHLEASRPSASTTGTVVGKTRENLAKTLVNGFVNAGFGNETMISNDSETHNDHWIFKNTQPGIRCGSASVGLSMLWDVDSGIDFIDKYSYSAEENVKAGGILATGIMHAGIRREPDIPWALLEDHLESKNPIFKHMAMMGIAVSHAGWHRPDISSAILPFIADEASSMETASLAALTLGFTFVGSGDGEVASTILQTMMERSEEELNSEWTIFMSLALGLNFLGCQEASDATVETLHAIEHPMARTAEILVDTCSYAGTGNVLKVQQMLHVLSKRSATSSTDTEDSAAAAAEDEADADAEDIEVDESAANTTTTPVNPTAPRVPEAAATAAEAAPAADAAGDKDKDKEVKDGCNYQSVAVIGIALIAMGEEVGSEMALRHFQHLMTYGEPQIRKAVPLALGLISASRPQLPILDTLSKYSHDSDLQVACNAIFAMGLVGAGTNNARLAQMLRALAVYYSREPDCYLMTRVAQGLVHMGKGTIGLNPFFHDGQIMSRSAMAGLLSVIISMTDAQSFILKDTPWMLYWLVTAMYPQFLITLDEESEEKAVTVRVGQAVNTVGLAGTRMGISGFQTHQTPVRIATGERAELGTNEFFPYSSVLEGLVIMKKNDGYDAEDQ